MLDEISRLEQGEYNIIVNEPCEVKYSVDEALMSSCFIEETREDILEYIITRLKSEYNCKDEFEALSHWKEYKGVLNGR